MAHNGFLMYWRDFVDVLLASLLFWGVITWLRRTRAFVTFIGLSILAAVYLGARQLDLRLTAWIFQGFAAVLLVLIVVVFQDDLRRLLEQIGGWGLRRRSILPAQEAFDPLVRAVASLAQTRCGALLVFPGKEALHRHLEGGIELEARLSEPLLLSLFDTSSPGHDGAAVVVGDRIERFAVHLPLSDDRAQLGQGGTRHAAALGLAERCDALAVVVSEERGTVSVAHMGRLRRLGSPQDLTSVLRKFHAGLTPAPTTGKGLAALAARQWQMLALSVGLAAGLWLLLGPGSRVVEVARTARVVVENLPKGYELESVTPAQVTVVLSAPRRRLLLAPTEQVQVRIDALLAQLGRRTFQVSPEQVVHPPNTKVIEVSPDTVRLSIQEKGPPKTPR